MIKDLTFAAAHSDGLPRLMEEFGKLRSRFKLSEDKEQVEATIEFVRSTLVQARNKIVSLVEA